MSEKNVLSIEDRIPKLKQERKKKTNRRLIFYLSIFFLLVSLVVYLQSPLSNIKTIKVSGLTYQTNIWSINKNEISEILQENPMVSNAKVKRSLPQTVEITVNEFTLVGFLKKDENYIPVIEDGDIIKDRQTKKINGEAPLLFNFTEEEYLEKMAMELQQLPASISNLIS